MLSAVFALVLFVDYEMVLSRTIVDMSYVLGPDSTSYLKNPPFNITPLVHGVQPGGFWLEFNWYSSNEHRSTHVDAPAHFFSSGLHMHEIPLEKFIGPGIVLRAVAEAANDPDFQITRDFIVNWEAVNGRIPEKAIVVMDFGWGSRYVNFDNSLIFNTKHYNTPSTYHFPGMAVDGMEFLVKQRHINVIGTDAPSLDYGQSTHYKSHVMSCSNNVPIIENLANLNKLPLRGSEIFAPSIKIQGGSGAPARVFAILNDETPNCKPINSAMLLIGSWTTLISFAAYIIIN